MKTKLFWRFTVLILGFSATICITPVFAQNSEAERQTKALEELRRQIADLDRPGASRTNQVPVKEVPPARMADPIVATETMTPEAEEAARKALREALSESTIFIPREERNIYIPADHLRRKSSDVTPKNGRTDDQKIEAHKVRAEEERAKRLEREAQRKLAREEAQERHRAQQAALAEAARESARTAEAPRESRPTEPPRAQTPRTMPAPTQPAPARIVAEPQPASAVAVDRARAELDRQLSDLSSPRDERVRERQEAEERAREEKSQAREKARAEAEEKRAAERQTREEERARRDQERAQRDAERKAQADSKAATAAPAREAAPPRAATPSSRSTPPPAAVAAASDVQISRAQEELRRKLNEADRDRDREREEKEKARQEQAEEKRRAEEEKLKAREEQRRAEEEKTRAREDQRRSEAEARRQALERRPPPPPPPAAPARPVSPTPAAVPAAPARPTAPSSAAASDAAVSRALAELDRKLDEIERQPEISTQKREDYHRKMEAEADARIKAGKAARETKPTKPDAAPANVRQASEEKGGTRLIRRPATVEVAPADAPSTPPAVLDPPPSTLPKSKQQKLDELLQLYRQDKITPREYQERRAKVLAEP